MLFVIDSRYSLTSITNTLKSIFSNNSLLFKVAIRGTKVAIIVTKTKDSSTYIFTNYNSPRNRLDNYS